MKFIESSQDEFQPNKNVIINTKNIKLKSGKHIIFYQLIAEDEIEVIRILHERMDLKNKMNKKLLPIHV